MIFLPTKIIFYNIETIRKTVLMRLLRKRECWVMIIQHIYSQLLWNSSKALSSSNLFCLPPINSSPTNLTWQLTIEGKSFQLIIFFKFILGNYFMLMHRIKVKKENMNAIRGRASNGSSVTVMAKCFLNELVTGGE